MAIKRQEQENNDEKKTSREEKDHLINGTKTTDSPLPLLHPLYLNKRRADGMMEEAGKKKKLWRPANGKVAQASSGIIEKSVATQIRNNAFLELEKFGS